jgi:hypothetical protein
VSGDSNENARSGSVEEGRKMPVVVYRDDVNIAKSGLIGITDGNFGFR